MALSSKAKSFLKSLDKKIPKAQAGGVQFPYIQGETSDLPTDPTTFGQTLTLGQNLNETSLSTPGINAEAPVDKQAGFQDVLSVIPGLGEAGIGIYNLIEAQKNKRKQRQYNMLSKKDMQMRENESKANDFYDTPYRQTNQGMMQKGGTFEMFNQFYNGQEQQKKKQKNWLETYYSQKDDALKNQWEQQQQSGISGLGSGVMSLASTLLKFQQGGTKNDAFKKTLNSVQGIVKNETAPKVTTTSGTNAPASIGVPMVSESHDNSHSKSKSRFREHQNGGTTDDPNYSDDFAQAAGWLMEQSPKATTRIGGKLLGKVLTPLVVSKDVAEGNYMRAVPEIVPFLPELIDQFAPGWDSKEHNETISTQVSDAFTKGLPAAWEEIKKVYGWDKKQDGGTIDTESLYSSNFQSPYQESTPQEDVVQTKLGGFAEQNADWIFNESQEELADTSANQAYFESLGQDQTTVDNSPAYSYGSSSGDVIDRIGQHESGGSYDVVNPTSGTTGKYQFHPRYWGEQIRSFMGLPNDISTEEVMGEFKKNPAAQDKFMRHVVQDVYKPAIQQMKPLADKYGFTEDQMIKFVHYRGIADTKKRLQTGDFQVSAEEKAKYKNPDILEYLNQQ